MHMYEVYILVKNFSNCTCTGYTDGAGAIIIFLNIIGKLKIIIIYCGCPSMCAFVFRELQFHLLMQKLPPREKVFGEHEKNEGAVHSLRCLAASDVRRCTNQR